MSAMCVCDSGAHIVDEYLIRSNFRGTLFLQILRGSLHEHIMACPQEGNDEVLPVTTPLVYSSPGRSTATRPALSNQTQVDAPSPSATPSLPRPIAAVNPLGMSDEFTRHRNWRDLQAVFFCYKRLSGLPFTEELQQWVGLAWLAFPVSLSHPMTVVNH